MIKLPRPRNTKQSQLLAAVADWLRQHQAAEELRVRRCFKLEPDTWRSKTQ